MKKRKGVKYLKGLPKDEHIVSMVKFKGKIIIATTKGVYELKDGKIEKIKLKTKK